MRNLLFVPQYVDDVNKHRLFLLLVKTGRDSQESESYVTSFPVLSFIKKVGRKLAFLGTLIFLFYWTKKLFALEYSKKHKLKSRVGKKNEGSCICVIYVP